ncbi:MAG: hypothetical protein ACRDLF_14435 [Solirubrobacteraceae bacterium]
MSAAVVLDILTIGPAFLQALAGLLRSGHSQQTALIAQAVDTGAALLSAGSEGFEQLQALTQQIQATVAGTAANPASAAEQLAALRQQHATAKAQIAAWNAPPPTPPPDPNAIPEAGLSA